MANTTASFGDPALVSPVARTSGRLADIERSKGMAIILVVLAHLVKFETLNEPGWYALLKEKIYYFHMPFFLYLSGFVFFYVGSQIKTGESYWPFLRKRAERLLIPFVAFLFILVIGKEVASKFVYVDNQPHQAFLGFYYAIFETEKSPVISIWYVYVLFVFSAITPLFWSLAKRSMVPLLGVALVMHFLPMTDSFYLDRVFKFYLFFLIGGYVALNRDRLLPLMDRFRPALLLVFAASFLLVPNSWDPLLLVGTLSLLALHSLMRSPVFDRDRVLLFLGRYVFVIYLFNTVFIGLAKSVYVKVLPTTGSYFFVLLLVTSLAGLVLPVLLKVFVLRKSQVLDRITD